MELRQTILRDRLVVIRAFLLKYLELIKDFCPPDIILELDRLINGMNRIEEAQREQLHVVLGRQRDELRQKLIAEHAKPIVSGARTCGLKAPFARFTRPTRFQGRRFGVYMDTLLNTAGAHHDRLKPRMVPGFLERARELTREYVALNGRVWHETEHAPKLTEYAAEHASEATALITHIHNLLAPHIGTLAIRLEWEQARQLPSHHADASRRLGAGSSPPRLLPSGDPTEVTPPDQPDLNIDDPDASSDSADDA